jgi:hypothetical protein
VVRVKRANRLLTSKKVDSALRMLAALSMFSVAAQFLSNRPPPTWVMVFFFIFCGVYIVASLVDRLIKWVFYHHYVGKSWLYHCTGHSDGTTCEHDGQRCVVFPISTDQTKFMEFMERQRNVTVYEATFASGQQGFVHISSLQKI